MSEPQDERRLEKPSEREVPVQYPSSSETPITEGSRQSSAVKSWRNALEQHFRNRPDVFVSGRLGIWLEDGNEGDVMKPDVMVALDAWQGERWWYYVWVEGKPPDFACDVSDGPQGRFTDIEEDTKALLARNVGIREYVLYNPGYEGRPSTMKMYRLEDGDYVSVTPDKRGEFESRTLGLGIRPGGVRVRLRDLESGKRLPGMLELARELRSERRARRAEAMARRDAERRVAELEAVIQTMS